ncbi:MAG: 2-phosphosulfolactate phosphatase [Ignavibacteria bacterium]
MASVSDVVIIVDILSFSTSVDIVTGRGSIVYPYKWKDGSAVKFSESVNGILAADKRSFNRFSLSPSSLLNIPEDIRFVLPSPNGATLSLSTGNTFTLCGCIRNAKAVAEFAMTKGEKITVIPAGEKWPDESLRPAVEDLIGAGAIINYLKGILSPESESALSVFRNSIEDLRNVIMNCSSGKELIEKGFENDVELACKLNESNCVPGLVDGVYVNLSVDQ